MLPDVLSVVARALSFVCSLQAAGVALFLAIFGHELSVSTGTIRRLGYVSALAAVVLVLLHYSLESARMAGDMAGIADASLQRFALISTTGACAALRLLGLVLLASSLRREGGFMRLRGLMGAALLALSFVVTGHTSVHPERWLLAPLLMLHLLVIEFWFGALAPLYLISLREPRSAAAQTIEGFTVLATWLVPLIFVAGLLMAIVLLPDLMALRQPYGELLLAKIAGFTLLMFCASANKWRLAPAIKRGEEEGARRFRQSVGTEYVLIVAVLAVTTVMTSFFSPDS